MQSMSKAPAVSQSSGRVVENWLFSKDLPGMDPVVTTLRSRVFDQRGRCLSEATFAVRSGMPVSLGQASALARSLRTICLAEAASGYMAEQLAMDVL